MAAQAGAQFEAMKPTKEELKQMKIEAKFQREINTDWKRMIAEPDPRDPRCHGWPCQGEHSEPVKFDANAYGRWKHCTKCDLRLKYVPMVGSPGTNTKHALPCQVSRALEACKGKYSRENISAQIVRAELEVVIQQDKLEAAVKATESVPSPVPGSSAREHTSDKASLCSIA